MRKLTLIALVVVLALLGGGIVFALTLDIPAPTERMEKVIPNDRFPR